MKAEDTTEKSSLQQRIKTIPEGLSVNPKDTANFFSVLVFSWLGSLLTEGKKKTLEDEDLLPLSKNSEAKQLTKSRNSEWQREIEDANKNRKLPRLWMVYRLIPVRSYLIMFCLCVCTSFASVAQPLTLGLFLIMLYDRSRSVQSSVLYTLALSGVSAVKFLTMHHSEYLAELRSLKLCAATTGLIYNKVGLGTITFYGECGKKYALDLMCNLRKG